MQAGSHPFQWTTTVVLNADAETGGRKEFFGEVAQPALPKDLHFELPPGMVGDPCRFQQCRKYCLKVIMPDWYAAWSCGGDVLRTPG